MAKKSGSTEKKRVETLTHDEASRKNIPTAELESFLEKTAASPVQVAYQRRNRDLDPQLVWRGKDEQDWSDLVVPAPPLFIQEKVHPKALIDDLMRRTEKAASKQPGFQTDLFADFNGLPSPDARTEFYQHDANWTNRLILGDSLQVMASLAEREGLRGQVQCIYIDPPYGIKFNSNFQWSTTSNRVSDGKAEHITREPEQVKAFRDTWRDGVHSYLTYLRDRLTISRDLLAETGSVFVQIGDENVHRVRSLLDEIFGERNFCAQIHYRTSVPLTSVGLPSVADHILWYAKNREHYKFRDLFVARDTGEKSRYSNVELPDGTRRTLTAEERRDLDALGDGLRPYSLMDLASSGYTPSCTFEFNFRGRTHKTSSGKSWKTTLDGMALLAKANRLADSGKTVRYVIFHDDFPVTKLSNAWLDTTGELNKDYVVQTHTRVVERCLLMASDPGDLVLDPTCGAGTTAVVAEQWGRRWITIDTSRVALALARARIMGARFPFYILSDSDEGRDLTARIDQKEPSSMPTEGRVRFGFVHERVPHITLGRVANNTEIDVIWEKFQTLLEPLRERLNKALGEKWEEWEIPREAESKWPAKAKDAHAEWWKQRIARQKEIDASIAAKAEYEYLFDKPYEDKKKVRVAGPFTVESLSPHRSLAVDEQGDVMDVAEKALGFPAGGKDFTSMILENLRVAGVQQADKADRIAFTSLTPWPGQYVCAEGRYLEGKTERRAGIFIGPEFGTVSRADLVEAARECSDAEFDVLVACAFNYDVHTTEFSKLGKIPVLKARMNADLHMAEDLKNTGKGNLFVVFGEPDIDLLEAKNGQVRVKVKGVDVFHPTTGEVRSDGPEGIACWFIDTDYDGESFFVRHAYFLGANDPYKALKTTLKAEVDEDAWESLHSDTSRPFDKPKSKRIAVKVINHLGDEVMKVFRVP